MLTAKLDCSGVCFHRLLSTTFAGAPARSSMTNRVLPFADSLRSSVMPSMTLRLTASAILRSMPSTEVWYGISVTTMRDRLPSSTISARARMRTDPRPVDMAAREPARPNSKPRVGKSGPCTNPIRSSTVASGLRMRWMVASMTSPRLCVGILVAMPTAMPWLPLMSRFGNRDGMTSGSVRDPSKLPAKSTVRSSMPSTMVMAKSVSRHSV